MLSRLRQLKKWMVAFVETSNKYIPELGQASFGCSWNEYPVDKEIGCLLSDLSQLLADSINFDSIYGTEYENKIFSMFPYYWGDCTCGLEEKESNWIINNPHGKNCPLSNKDESCYFDFNKCTCYVSKLYENEIGPLEHSGNCLLIKPNFYYKPSDLKISWYKYIGRGMSANRRIKKEEMEKIVDHCIKSAKQDIIAFEKEKTKQKQKQEKWLHERDNKSYICHRCINFIGELKNGQINCFQFSEEIEDGEHIVTNLIPISYCTECHFYIKYK